MHAAALRTWCKSSDVPGPRDSGFIINVSRYYQKLLQVLSQPNQAQSIHHVISDEQIYFRAMQNFFLFRPMIPFGNQKMKILETRSQKVNMDTYFHSCLTLYGKRFGVNFYNCFFVNCSGLFLVLGRSFFPTIGNLTNYTHSALRFYQTSSVSSRLFVTQNRSYKLYACRDCSLCVAGSQMSVHIATQLPYV